MEDELLTTAQAAIYLGIAQSTMRTYIQKQVLIPTTKHFARGHPHLFRKNDLDALKDNAAWKGPLVSTTRGKSVYRHIVDRPTEDEHHSTGCIIHWPRRLRKGNQTFIPITCAACNNEFDKGESQLLVGLQSDAFTGCCNKCFVRRRKPPVLRNNGITHSGEGYIMRHWRTFTDDEWAILSQMRPGNGIYIPEHRAVVALALGRPLLETESVHHVNGDIHDNRLENLQLYTQSDHSRLHKDQLARELLLLKRIEELEQYILKLESAA